MNPQSSPLNVNPRAACAMTRQPSTITATAAAVAARAPLDAESVADEESVTGADRWSMAAADPESMADANRGPQRGIGAGSSCGR